MHKPLTYLSVCSGIESASVAWQPIDWQPIGFAEIEPFASAVLAHHWPEVKNYGDITKFREWTDVPGFDVLVGGTPCQSYSIAGLREGLNDPRGQLMLTFGAIARRFRPDWVVWENVDDVLSSDGGRAFGTFLGMLAEIGYGFAYRIFDAQFSGVPQRRNRVYVVGYLGDWRPPASVLFERESLQGSTSKGKRKKRESSGFFEARSGVRSEKTLKPLRTKYDSHTPEDNHIVQECKDIAHTLMTKNNRNANHDNYVAVSMRGREGGAMMEVQGDKTSALRASSGGITRDYICFTANDNGRDVQENISPTLRSGNGARNNGGVVPAVLGVSENQRGEVRTHEKASAVCASSSGKMGQGQPYVYEELTSYVRRLTPLECERLQGLPDNHTNIIYRGKPATKTPRYHAIGNAMPVPDVRWIGERIDMVRKLMGELACTY